MKLAILIVTCIAAITATIITIILITGEKRRIKSFRALSSSLQLSNDISQDLVNLIKEGKTLTDTRMDKITEDYKQLYENYLSGYEELGNKIEAVIQKEISKFLNSDAFKNLFVWKN